VVVKTVVLGPIELPDDLAESIKLRIEVLRWSSERFTCQVWRRETYRMRPSLGEPATEGVWEAEVYVLETGLDWETVEGPSSEDVIEQVLQRIEAGFGVDVGRETPNAHS